MGIQEEPREDLVLIEQGIDSLISSEEQILRLRMFWDRSSCFFSSVEFEDVLNETITCLLEGKRRYPIGLDFFVFFLQVFRSVADNLRKKTKNLVLNCDEKDFDGKCERDTEEFYHNSLLVELLENMFRNDEEVQSLLLCIVEGQKKSETIEIFEWDEDKYLSVKRRLTRGAQKIKGETI